MDIVNLIRDIRAIKSTLRLKFTLSKQEREVIGLESVKLLQDYESAEQ